MMRISVPALFVSLLAASANAAGIIRDVPDSEWDHILRGSEILSRRDGEAAQRYKYLENYTMRSRAANASAAKVDTVKQISGYMDDSVKDKHLFFWFFESRNKPETDPVVLWLNGGPGCSSMVGLLTELGPKQLNRETHKFERNAYAWNNNASVIFVDQPVNSGFSYSSHDDGTSTASARDLYSLLAFFFRQYPEYAGRDFHIAGESYAGHYIPLAAKEILGHKDRSFNLTSVLIGNGLTDPLVQYKYYHRMVCRGDRPVLGETSCQRMKKMLPGCTAEIKHCYKTKDDQTCLSATNICNEMSGIFAETGRSVYDITKKRTPLEEPDLTRFLSTPKIMEAIGARRPWKLCESDHVYKAFQKTGDWMKKDPVRAMPGVLAEVPVLIYAGDKDYICNWLGNQAWTKALKWPGKAGFNKAPEQQLWLSNSTGSRGREHGKGYGTLTRSGNLSFMRIFDAGHMVPEDQPEASLDFFNRWIGGEWRG